MNSFKITGAEIDRADAGQVVARTLNASDPREVATLGLVRIAVTPEFYVERLADIVNFKRDEAILQIGTFGDPPDVDDIAGLTLDEWDVRRLRECRVGDCGVQMSAEGIERFRTGVDWRRDDAYVEASRMMRQVLVKYVTLYRHAGSGASMQYQIGVTRSTRVTNFVRSSTPTSTPGNISLLCADMSWSIRRHRRPRRRTSSIGRRNE